MGTMWPMAMDEGGCDVADLLKDRAGRELPLPDGISLEEGVLSIEGHPWFQLDDPERLDPGLLDLLARAVSAVDDAGH